MKEGNIQFEIIVGTYEEFVLGYQFLLDRENENKGELAHTFATHSHRASVRSVASKGKLVVSGGADETINIYNMFTRKECGMLMEHNGTVTSLNFTPDCSHLISTSEDGLIKIFRQGSWQVEKVWSSAHKGQGVTWLSIHPSGKMALSVGKDHTLRTWNLVKGRPAYTTNLYSRCRQLEYVTWSPGGELFAIPMDTKLEISCTQKGGVLHTITRPSKITACNFLSDEVLCVGEAGGIVSGISTESSEQLWSIPGEERIRGVEYLHSHLVTVTSSGAIRVYRADDVKSQPQFVVSINTGCRITCLALYDYKGEIKVKKEPLDEKKSDRVDQSVSSGKEAKKRNTFDSQETISFKTPSGKELKKKNTLDSQEKISVKTPSIGSKKRKLSNADVVCSPSSQRWVVEDSNR